MAHPNREERETLEKIKRCLTAEMLQHQFVFRVVTGLDVRRLRSSTMNFLLEWIDGMGLVEPKMLAKLVPSAAEQDSFRENDRMVVVTQI